MSKKGIWATRICEVCEKEFSIPERALIRGRGRVCSAQCRGMLSVGKMNANRPNPKGYAKPPIRHGAANNKWVPAVQLVCKNCIQPFERKPWQLRGGRTGDYCSKACRDAYRNLHEAGEHSPFWVGGPKTYRGRNWLRARAVVVTEQSGICADCKRFIGNSLPVHHIRPYREFQSYKQANDRTNLIGLCQSCHMKREPRPSKANQSFRPEHR